MVANVIDERGGIQNRLAIRKMNDHAITYPAAQTIAQRLTILPLAAKCVMTAKPIMDILASTPSELVRSSCH
jgi:hypothetical protein